MIVIEGIKVPRQEAHLPAPSEQSSGNCPADTDKQGARRGADRWYSFGTKVGRGSTIHDDFEPSV